MKIDMRATQKGTGPGRWVRGCALILAATLSPLFACKRQPPPPPEPPPPPVPVLGPVAVADLTPRQLRVPGVTFDVQALSARAHAQLEAGGIFATPGDPDGGLPPVAEVRLGFMIEDVHEGDKALGRAIAKLSVNVKPSGKADPYWLDDVEAAGELPYDPTTRPPPVMQEVFDSLIGRMLDGLIKGYVARQKLRRADDAHVLQVLRTPEAEGREDAIRMAGARRLKKAVPDLLDLLEDDHETLRDAALGALLEMRERAAVSRLANSRSMRDSREMRKIIEAISLLGGDEAVSYLSFVADAHQDPDLKAMAKDALQRLRRRQGEHDEAAAKTP